MAPSTAPFPPGKGGGEGVAHGYKGKGVLIHSLVDGGGMPLAAQTTPANADERKQVEPLLDEVKVKRKRGRPRKRLRKIACDKGYDAQDLREKLRRRGIKPEIAKRVWKSKPRRGRPAKSTAPRYIVERNHSWFQRKFRRIVVRWERIPLYFNAFLAIAFSVIWMQKIILLG
jgi:transposase